MVDSVKHYVAESDCTLSAAALSIPWLQGKSLARVFTKRRSGKRYLNGQKKYESSFNQGHIHSNITLEG